MDQVAAELITAIRNQFKQAYDLQSKLLFFPVRHHSPLCTYHLLRTLEAYKPDAILIEGPSDTNHLLEHITDKDSQAPICIYYAYTDENNIRSSCYFPMLDYSPELAALRYGAEHKLHTAFIDLPYSALSEKDEDDEDDDGLNKSYYSDYYISRSQYITSLCEKQNCRNYSELWEKFFEVNGLEIPTEKFVQNMLALCYLSRIEYPAQMLEDEGCINREEYMAAEILKACKDHKKILVVTGGFHTGGLLELINSKKNLNQKTYSKSDSYLIPYSYEESDQLSGYASGMPYPAFYQRVHSNISHRNQNEAFDEAVMHFLVKSGNELRAKGINVSLSEESAAFVQCKGLANLRGKTQPGVYELIDGITSAYVKSELNILSSEIMKTCKYILRGTERGKVTDKTDIVPLLKDFRESVSKFKLKTSTAKQDLELDILSNPKHRQISIFFRRLSFLGVPYAHMIAGPDYKKQDTSRVRERWQYVHNAKVEASIIDASYLGGTVGEAASNLINKKQDTKPASSVTKNCAFFSELLIDVIVMDLPDFIAPLLDNVRTAITEDGAFESLAEAASNLMFIEQIKWMLRDNSTENTAHMDILELIYAKASSMLPYLSTKDENEDRHLAKLTKRLYQVASLDNIDESIFYEALQDLVQQDNPPPFLHGCALGLLYSRDNITVSDMMSYANAYLFGTGEMMKRSGLFLGGIFYTAWDIIFHHSEFVDGISNVLSQLDEDSFLVLLPDLRLAFSTFSPSNINRIAETVAQSLGHGDDMLIEKAVPEKMLSTGIKLDEYATEILRQRGLA